MSKRKQKHRLYLTHRALADIDAIETHSVAEWGRRTAAKYLADIEQTLELVRENPGLLQSLPEFHPEFRFYRTGKHVLVCDRQPHAIYVLTLLHTSRDIPARLTELEPTLVAEVDLLHKKLGQNKR